MSFNLTAIIAFKNKENRLRNLQYILGWLESLPSIKEIIVVEQDSTSSIYLVGSKFSKLTHIFVYNPGNFNKSLGFNIGARFATFQKLLFTDSDIIFDFSKIKNELDLWDFDAMSPYSHVIDLDKNDSELVATDPVKFETIKNRPFRDGICFAGGSFFIDKAMYEKLGGFNENFYLWGGEDDFFSTVLEKTCKKTTVINQMSYHLYHERDLTSTYENPFYQSNLSILESARVLETDQIHFLNQIFSKYNSNIEKYLKLNKGGYKEFKAALGERESSNNYSVINSFGFMGKYQLGYDRLFELGLVVLNGTCYDWKNGLDQEKFLENEYLQEVVFDLHFFDVLNRLVRSYSSFINFKINETNLSFSGMFAGVHLLGFESIDKRLKSGEEIKDAYGTSIDTYLELFSGYEIFDYFNTKE